MKAMKKEDENPAVSVPEDVKPESSPVSEPMSPTGAADLKAVDGNRDGQVTPFISELAKISLGKIAISIAVVFAVGVLFFLFYLTGEVRHLQEKNAALESQLKVLRANSESANMAIKTLQNQLAAFEQQVSQNLDKQQAVIHELQHSRSLENIPAPAMSTSLETKEGIKKNDDPKQNYINFVESVVKKLFTMIRNIFVGIWEFLASLAS